MIPEMVGIGILRCLSRCRTNDQGRVWIRPLFASDIKNAMKRLTLIVLVTFSLHVDAQETNYRLHDFSQVDVDNVDTERLQ